MGKVVNLQVKQIEKDPEIQQAIAQMEKYFFAKTSMLTTLTSEKIQESLDKEAIRERMIALLIKEYGEVIWTEARSRASEEMKHWIIHSEEKHFAKEDVIKKFQQFIAEAEFEVFKEVAKEMLEKCT